MLPQLDAAQFSHVPCGSSGREIRNQNGHVIAWTVDEAWAAVIVGLLNKAEVSISPASLE